ncbi:type IV secretory pathway VirB10-like protein [Paenibacillus phyllosphaerae]|uniref:Type IV secretory pathway VirB10-like protein n=1 Tax=Paenibacillus phyllosphaerae TaxID=274593 RepID=A0A7W5ATZ5_9BACL|nr:hypothetical protein [Paenibacillus phyllosphaerae]MBB3108534.1 type IV secretory pathway VirB10-like protein [Paenibacillus phyllosphaerae]
MDLPTRNQTNESSGGAPTRKSRSRKRWVIALSTLGVLVIAGFIAYPFAMAYVSDKMMSNIADQIVSPSEMEEMKKDPEIQKILKENIPNISLPEITETVAETTTDQETDTVASNTEAQDTDKQDSTTKSTSGTTDTTTTNSEKSTSTSTKSDDSASSTSNVMTKDEASKLLLSKFSKSELLKLAEKANGGLTAEEKKEIKDKLLSRISDSEFKALKVAAVVELAKQDGN